MKHRNLLLRLVVVTFIFALNASYATAQQQSHRIKSIYRTYRGEPDLNFYLHYLEDGRISKAETEHLDYNGSETIDFAYDDANEMITMSADRVEKWGNSSTNWSASPKISLQNGKIISYESYGEDQDYPVYGTVSYDARGYVSKIVLEDKKYKEESVYTPEWSDGNLIKMVCTATDGYSSYVDVSEYEYTDYPNPKSNILFSPYFEDFDAFYIPIPNNYLSNFMGVRTKNLPKRLVKSPKDEGDDPRREDYSYVFDDNGNILEIVVTDKKGEYLHFWITYETFVDTSVSGLKDDSREPVAYYNSLGQKVENLGKGMNIIRYSDKSVKKVVIR